MEARVHAHYTIRRKGRGFSRDCCRSNRRHLQVFHLIKPPAPSLSHSAASQREEYRLSCVKLPWQHMQIYHSPPTAQPISQAPILSSYAPSYASILNLYFWCHMKRKRLGFSHLQPRFVYAHVVICMFRQTLSSKHSSFSTNGSCRLGLAVMHTCTRTSVHMNRFLFLSGLPGTSKDFLRVPLKLLLFYLTSNLWAT